MKLWDLYTKEFYSALSKKIIKFIDKYVGLENIILRKINITCSLSYVDHNFDSLDLYV